MTQWLCSQMHLSSRQTVHALTSQCHCTSLDLCCTVAMLFACGQPLCLLPPAMPASCGNVQCGLVPLTHVSGPIPAAGARESIHKCVLSTVAVRRQNTPTLNRTVRQNRKKHTKDGGLSRSTQVQGTNGRCIPRYTAADRFVMRLWHKSSVQISTHFSCANALKTPQHDKCVAGHVQPQTQAERHTTNRTPCCSHLTGRKRQTGRNYTVNPARLETPHSFLRSASCIAHPLCDIPPGCCFFTGPWIVTRSSLCMLRRVAAFCWSLRPVLLLASFPRSRSPVVGVLGLCGCGMMCHLRVSGAQ